MIDTFRVLGIAIGDFYDNFVRIAWSETRFVT